MGTGVFYGYNMQSSNTYYRGSKNMSQTSAGEGNASQDQRKLSRRLNLFDSTMLVVGAMIGSGIFIVPAEMTRQIGAAGWLLLA